MSENKPASPPKKRFDTQLLFRILSLAKPYQGFFIFAALGAVILAPLSSLRPYLIQQMVDEHIFKYDVEGMTKLVTILLVLLFLDHFNYLILRL